MSGSVFLNNIQFVPSLNEMRETIRDKFREKMKKITGRKEIILDPKSVGSLGLMIDITIMKECGIQKFLYLKDNLPPLEKYTNRIFFIPPKLLLIKTLTNYLQKVKKFTKKEEIERYEEIKKENHYLFLYPRKTILCDEILEEDGVYDLITVDDFDLGIIPFETDVLTLELDSDFRKYRMNDISSLYYITTSLLNLQKHVGKIPEIKWIGEKSKFVAEMLKKHQEETENQNQNQNAKKSEIDSLIIFDRKTDMITPLVTQINYEGLINEVFVIKNTYVELPAKWLDFNKEKEEKSQLEDNKEQQQPVVKTDPNKRQKYVLNSTDLLFTEIRDRNMGEVGAILNSKAKEISKEYGTRFEPNQSISSLRKFVQKLPHLQDQHFSLSVHIKMTQEILAITSKPHFSDRMENELALLAGEITDANEYIENLINKQDKIQSVFRILCLQSLILNGLKQKDFDFFRKEIVQVYGHKYIFSLYNLQKFGILKLSESKSNFPQIRKIFNLINFDFDKSDDHVYSVFSGYAPISVRIIQQAFEPGWESIKNQLFLLENSSFGTIYNVSKKELIEMEEKRKKTKVVLVFFIGGVTHAEISGLRLLEKDQGNKFHYVIATTKIIDGAYVSKSFIDPLVF
ncbi:vacuolar protein sorting-associated protein 33a [Anaeramoeba ignava]|uniref:Vacuolar protein sorting-associated protein 33a n=1 Tax=Anaeramoeba ignava TaxID=1746090 RepID=A0A9Q0LM23_ANAIG|nr:vacuolar protein sorting-associated protein 33a [Anaeramoeba ignava]